MTAANAPEDTHLDVRSIDRRVLSAHPNKAGIDLALLKIGGAEDC